MVTSEITIPGYRPYEYMIVLNPHEELNNKLSFIRKEFYTEYKMQGVPSTKSNLMIARFTQLEMFEERIINKLKHIAMGFAPFKVEIKDFGSFPSHTIYFNVTSKVPIQNLIKEIKTETQRLMKLDADNKPYFNNEPHITIGNKLKPWQYEKAWLEFSNRHFTGRFIADQMLLLKRGEGDKNFIVARRFAFENMPVATKQGELF